jgi:hypothetical protein
VAGTCDCGNEPSVSIKCGGISCLAENRLASKEELCSVENIVLILACCGKRINNLRLQFLPYGRSIGSWICLTHKTYTRHTVQNTYTTKAAMVYIYCYNCYITRYARA